MVGAIIVAAGESRRMGGTDKVFAQLAGKPVLLHALEPFQRSPMVDRIVVVAGKQNLEKCFSLLDRKQWSKIANIVPGGERRQDSVQAGLRELTGCAWVIIHDAARPLMEAFLIEDGLEAARETGSAIAAVPVKDTIKIADGALIRETPERSKLWMAQTPQVFRFDIIDKAYKDASGDATDDASLVERAGYKVKIYTGSYRNIKITTPDDLACARALLAEDVR